MGKYPSSNERPARPRAGLKMLEDVKAILRAYPQGDQSPELLLGVDTLKVQLKDAGHAQVVGDHIESAFDRLEKDGLVRLGPRRMGGWKITWISPQI